MGRSSEAASVKPSQQWTGFIVTAKTSNPSRTTWRNFSLKFLIMDASGLADYQVRGPSWLPSERYDIVAVKPPGTKADQARLMMQSLLPAIPGCKSFGTLAEFAHILSGSLDAPVVDRTRISGSFYFILAYSNNLDTASYEAAGSPPPPPPAPPPCPGWEAATMPPLASNIFDAVREQMGLRLERRGNGPVNKTPEKISPVHAAISRVSLPGARSPYNHAT
jgi:hypothetical protein